MHIAGKTIAQESVQLRQCIEDVRIVAQVNDIETLARVCMIQTKAPFPSRTIRCRGWNQDRRRHNRCQNYKPGY